MASSPEEAASTTDGEVLRNSNEEFVDNESDEEMQEQLRTERIRRRNRIILFLFLVAVVVFVIVDSLTNKYVSRALSSLYHWVDSYPLPGAFVLTIVVFVATLAFIPGALLTIGCGVVYGMILGLGEGVAVGSVVVFVGASLGSLVSFIMGRYLLRDCVGKWTARYPLFKAVDKAMEKKGFRIFFLLRLSPIIPFNALNYMAGMTSVSFRHYTLALIGLLPGTVLFVFVGSSAGSAMEDMKEDGSDKVERNARIASIGKLCLANIMSLCGSTKDDLIVVGVVIGVLGLVAVSYYAKKELNHIIAEQEQDTQQNGDLEQQVSSGCSDSNSFTEEVSGFSSSVRSYRMPLLQQSTAV